MHEMSNQVFQVIFKQHATIPPEQDAQYKVRKGKLAAVLVNGYTATTAAARQLGQYVCTCKASEIDKS